MYSVWMSNDWLLAKKPTMWTMHCFYSVACFSRFFFFPFWNLLPFHVPHTSSHTIIWMKSKLLFFIIEIIEWVQVILSKWNVRQKCHFANINCSDFKKRCRNWQVLCLLQISSIIILFQREKSSFYTFKSVNWLYELGFFGRLRALSYGYFLCTQIVLLSLIKVLAWVMFLMSKYSQALHCSYHRELKINPIRSLLEKNKSPPQMFWFLCWVDQLTCLSYWHS